MRRKILWLISAIILLGILALPALHLMIGASVKKNIEFAQEHYAGSVEESLLSLLLDESYSTGDRTHVAIWTLGQIRSHKALPVLKELYHDDPEGTTCYRHHDSLLCQYEIYKAISTIEHKPLFSHDRLNK